MPDLPRIPFGPDGQLVTRIGLGGEGVLRTYGREKEAQAVIKEAISQGITYFDTAPAYSDSQSYLGSIWGQNPEVRKKIFHTSKSAGRTYSQAMDDLRTSLQTLKTDYLDLWQIHDLRTLEEIQQIESPDGALKAFIQAKEQGLVKHIGVTGHHDPEILKIGIRNWPLDSVLLPVNPAEKHLGGFMDSVISEARNKEMTVIGMKCLGGGGYVQPQIEVQAQKLIRYALTCPVDLIIIGCSSPQEVIENVEALKDFSDIKRETSLLEEAFRPMARKLAFYRARS